MPLTGLAIAAALGLAKSEMVDRPKEERQRKLAAKTQELSPWTGLQAGKIQEADGFGSALQYGATGAQMGAAYDQSEADKQALAGMKNGGPWSYSYGRTNTDPDYFNKPYQMGAKPNNGYLD